MKINYNIVVTGGSGRFGSILKKKYPSKNIFYPTKKELNIISARSTEKYLKKNKPKILIHLAGLSRPMKEHEKNISKSIDLNIIGTANIVKICQRLDIKLVYFSTNYVYPGKKGNYKESDALLPINNYAWSKLGGEAAVQMYRNSLILRISMTEYPFVHKEAFIDLKNNFIFQEEIAKNLFKIIKNKGIINIGGKKQTIYNFAKKYNKKIIPISRKDDHFFNLYPDLSMNLKKMKKVLS
jgi:dTDP-4-dehydrorhamnose reductase